MPNHVFQVCANISFWTTNALRISPTFPQLPTAFLLRYSMDSMYFRQLAKISSLTQRKSRCCLTAVQQLYCSALLNNCQNIFFNNNRQNNFQQLLNNCQNKRSLQKQLSKQLSTIFEQLSKQSLFSTTIVKTIFNNFSTIFSNF